LLYGTTEFGGLAAGDNGAGTVFSVDPVTGVYRVVYAFGVSDGSYPNAGLIAVGGLLYSTTDGGDSGGGATTASNGVQNKACRSDRGTVCSFTS
jgi:uncharacterized repeat protein (TIGR03803 family)